MATAKPAAMPPSSNVSRQKSEEKAAHAIGVVWCDFHERGDGTRRSMRGILDVHAEDSQTVAGEFDVAFESEAF